MNTIFTTFPTPGEADEKEILRYAGAAKADETLLALLRETVKEAEMQIQPRVAYGIFDISVKENCVDFGFAKAGSKGLAKRLENTDRAVIFAATVGNGIDRLIAKYGKTSPARAVLLQAYGSERVEAVCDAFEEAFCKEAGLSREEISPRFSPGYGDLSLDFQKEIFRGLNCPAKVGITLNESLLMSPSKSVTAIFGFRGKA